VCACVPVCLSCAYQLDEEELAELSLVVVAREDILERVLEGEVARLRREVADDVGEVAAPIREEALLLVDTRKAVDDARVARHLARADARVGILGLNQELDSLERCCDCLVDRSGDTACEKVDHERRGSIGGAWWRHNAA